MASYACSSGRLLQCAFTAPRVTCYYYTRSVFLLIVCRKSGNDPARPGPARPDPATRESPNKTSDLVTFCRHSTSTPVSYTVFGDCVVLLALRCHIFGNCVVLLALRCPRAERAPRGWATSANFSPCTPARALIFLNGIFNISYKYHSTESVTIY